MRDKALNCVFTVYKSSVAVSVQMLAPRSAFSSAFCRPIEALAVAMNPSLLYGLSHIMGLYANYENK